MNDPPPNLPKLTIKVWLSDKAWSHLLLLARTQEYVRGEKARGMADWMDMLILVNPTPENWSDARPSYLRKRDLELLTAGAPPTWTSHQQRMIRVLRMDPYCVQRTTALARAKGTLKRDLPAHQSLRPITLLSEFWEAVGQEHLVPENRPPISMYNNPYASRKKYDLDF